MKKFLLIALCLSLVMFAAGCGNSEAPATGGGPLAVEEYETDNSNKMDLGSIGNTDWNVDVETYEAKDVEIDLGEIGDFKVEFADNLSEADMAKIDDLDETEMNELIEKKANMLDALTAAFNKAGINVKIDSVSGEASLDSTVLFGGDSAVLSSEGKDFLKKFIQAYSSVVFSDEYDGFVSKVMVEGHTAPIANSTYETGLPLSEERAETVMNYCLSADSGLSSDDIAKCSGVFESKGLSNTKPVKDSSGNVDLDASRRVSFRFIIAL